MSHNTEFVTVPIVRNFDHNDTVGSLTVAKAALPDEPTFVFSLGFLNSPPECKSEKYKLVCVSIMRDTAYVEFLHAFGLPVNTCNVVSSKHSFRDWLGQQPDYIKVLINSPMVEKALIAAYSAHSSCEARAEQLSTNCKWLLERIDEIHGALCPNHNGSWQSRANKAVDAAKLVVESRQCAL